MNMIFFVILGKKIGLLTQKCCYFGKCCYAFLDKRNRVTAFFSYSGIQLRARKYMGKVQKNLLRCYFDTFYMCWNCVTAFFSAIIKCCYFSLEPKMRLDFGDR